MADGKPTFGCILKMGAANPPTTVLGKRVSISPPKRTREAQDVTDHDSPGGAMEFIPDGVYNPGALEITMNYIAGDVDDDACTAAFAAGKQFFSWTANAATGTETFGPVEGVVTNYGPDPFPTSGKQTATMSVQLSGVAAQAATT